MAIKLLERGFRNFVVLEQAQVMGGTWRDNVYPGVACDVAAHLYSFSFAGNPWWQSRYAKGLDIWTYYHRVARRRGVSTFGTDLSLGFKRGWGFIFVPLSLRRSPNPA